MRFITTFLAALGFATHAVTAPTRAIQTAVVIPTHANQTAVAIPTHAKAQPRIGPVRLNQTATGLEERQRDFAHGWCGIHMFFRMSGLHKEALFWNVYVYDADHRLVAQQHFVDKWDGSVFGIYMLTHPVRTYGDLVDFQFFGDSWGSGPAGEKNDRCSVGDWYNPPLWSPYMTLELDCGFKC